MAVLKESGGITRRQFIKGLGLMGIMAVLGGTFSKLGIETMKVKDHYIEMRAAGLYTLDESMAIRKSHENPEIKAIYTEFLGKPLSERSEHLLHTSYVNRYQLLAG